MLLHVQASTVAPGSLGRYLLGLNSGAWAREEAALGPALGCFTVEVGVINCLIRLRLHEDLNDWEARRSQLFADPLWSAFRAEIADSLEEETEQIMVPAPFWPMAPTQPGPVGLVDFRSYTVRPGAMNAYLALYQQEGLALQLGYLGHCYGYYHSHLGEQNRVLHMWAYPDAGERAQRRARLNGDADWLAFVGRAQTMLLRQENTILSPVLFRL
jgi:hypothetical protein